MREQNAQLAESRDTLETATRHWHALFDLAPDGYLVTDPNGVIMEANQAAAVLLEMSPAGAGGHTTLDRHPPGSAASVLHSVAAGCP